MQQIGNDVFKNLREARRLLAVHDDSTRLARIEYEEKYNNV
jgi:hypothetical protein